LIARLLSGRFGSFLFVGSRSLAFGAFLRGRIDFVLGQERSQP
jgi:hypothetical protein